MPRLLLIYLLINSCTFLFSQESDESETFLNDLFGTGINAVTRNISSTDHAEILKALKKNIVPVTGVLITRKTDPIKAPAAVTIALTDEELETLRRKFSTPAGNYWVRDQTYSCSFADPVILRENTLCFFYYSVSCGTLCGESKFVVYKKVNGRWQHYMTIWEWIS